MTIRIWLLQDGEPLPCDDDFRPFRTAMLAEELVKAGHTVLWFAPAFAHHKKRMREVQPGLLHLSERYSIHLLQGNSYRSNMSPGRVAHYRTVAREFSRRAETLKKPELILGSYPSPELCLAGAEFAARHGIPFAADIRDPWPDIFQDYLPAALRPFTAPLCIYYRRMLTRILKLSRAIISVSESQLEWAARYAAGTNTARRVFHISAPGYSCAEQRTFPPFSKSAPLVALYAGSFGLSYDLSCITGAACLLQERGEERIRFIIAGDGEQNTKLRESAKNLKNVHFTGRLGADDLKNIAMQSHAGILPLTGGIRKYWLGNKLFEYMSAGLALINCSSAEAAGLIEKHAAGVTLPLMTPATLSESLCGYLDDPGLLGRHMKNSGDAFRTVFSPQVIYGGYARFLEELAASAGGSYSHGIKQAV